MEHREEPKSELPREILSLLDHVMHSPYASTIQKCVNEITGKSVVSTEGGTSGYALCFADDHFAVVSLKDDKMDILAGRGIPGERELAPINSSDYGDASGLLTVSLPYADEPCSIPDEVSKCRGMIVEGVSIGENTFSLCFPEGWELDASIVPDPEGKKALRVFWEQW
jgi:hypothetical protein